MKELFLNKELSLTAKEKGFDEPCFAYHTDTELSLFPTPLGETSKNSTFQYYPTAPLYQQILDWFREKHYINIYVTVDCSVNEVFAYDWTLHKIMAFGFQKPFTSGNELSYYKALEEAIKKAFEII